MDDPLLGGHNPGSRAVVSFSYCAVKVLRTKLSNWSGLISLAPLSRLVRSACSKLSRTHFVWP